MSSIKLENLLSRFKISKKILQNEYAKHCMMPMGVTSDNLAKKFNVSRDK
jgi:acetyl-CoA acyltransferase 1